MKKLLVILAVAFAGFGVYAANFYGHQSLNGLQTTNLFKAPAPGYYFVNGQLTLPWPSANGGSGLSQVTAVISAQGNHVYVGASGASGFQVNQISLVTGDMVQVILASPATIDQPINAVRGEVYYGNRF